MLRAKQRLLGGSHGHRYQVPSSAQRGLLGWEGQLGDLFLAKEQIFCRTHAGMSPGEFLSNWTFHFSVLFPLTRFYLPAPLQWCICMLGFLWTWVMLGRAFQLWGKSRSKEAGRGMIIMSRPRSAERRPPPTPLFLNQKGYLPGPPLGQPQMWLSAPVRQQAFN